MSNMFGENPFGLSNHPSLWSSTSSLGPSGMTTVDNGGSANQNVDSSGQWLSGFEDGSQFGRNLGLGLNIRDTDTNFDRTIDKLMNTDRDIDKDYEEALLSAEQCEKIENCLDQLQSDVCGKNFKRFEDLKEKADKIFDQACELETKLLDNIQCQINEAKNEFYREAQSRWHRVARAVGSSRNTFVIHQQNTAMVDLTSKLASLSAELQNSAILSAHENLRLAFSAQIAACNDTFNAMFGQMISLWQLIRGAKRTINEHTDDISAVAESIEEDSFQDVTTFDWTGKYAESTMASSNATTTFDGQSGLISLFAGTVGQP